MKELSLWWPRFHNPGFLEGFQKRRVAPSTAEAPQSFPSHHTRRYTHAPQRSTLCDTVAQSISIYCFNRQFQEALPFIWWSVSSFSVSLLPFFRSSVFPILTFTSISQFFHSFISFLQYLCHHCRLCCLDVYGIWRKHSNQTDGACNLRRTVHWSKPQTQADNTPGFFPLGKKECKAGEGDSLHRGSCIFYI